MSEEIVEPSEVTGLLDDATLADENSVDSTQAVDHRAAGAIETDPKERPEWWPENFWRNDAPDMEGIAKSWMDMRKMVSQGKHKAPADGNYDTSAMGEGPIENTPLGPTVLNWAKEHGISQGAFDSLVNTVRAAAAEFAPPEQKFDVAAEMKALGPNAEAIKNGMINWARGLQQRGVWDEADFEEFKVMGGTARGLRALMKVREHYGENIPIETEPMDGMPTDLELLSQIGDMNDPNSPYVKDPAYRARVQKLWYARYGAN